MEGYNIINKVEIYTKEGQKVGTSNQYLHGPEAFHFTWNNNDETEKALEEIPGYTRGKLKGPLQLRDLKKAEQNYSFDAGRKSLVIEEGHFKEILKERAFFYKSHGNELMPLEEIQIDSMPGFFIKRNSNNFLFLTMRDFMEKRAIKEALNNVTYFEEVDEIFKAYNELKEVRKKGFINLVAKKSGYDGDNQLELNAEGIYLGRYYSFDLKPYGINKAGKYKID